MCPGHSPLPGSSAVSHPKRYLFAVKIVSTSSTSSNCEQEGWLTRTNGWAIDSFSVQRDDKFWREIEMVPVPCPPAPLFDCAVCWVAHAGPLRFWEVAWCGCPAAPRKPEDRKGGRRVVVRSSSRPSQWHCLHNSCHGASCERHKPFNVAFPFPKDCLLCLWRGEFLCLRSEHPLFFFETNY